MAQDKERLNEFPPVSRETWRALVDRDLKGADFDRRLVKKVDGDIAVQPLYSAPEGSAPEGSAPEGSEPGASAAQHDPGLPGAAPFTRGADALGQAEQGWDIRQEHADPRPEVAAHALAEDLGRGGHSAWLRFDRATRDGSGDAARVGSDGLICPTPRSLAALLEAVKLDAQPIALEAGATALPLAAALVQLAGQRGVDPAQLRADFNADPIGTLSAEGRLYDSLDSVLEDMAELALWTHQNAPGVRSVLVSGVPYHNAGADAAEELGIALATGLSYLRSLCDAGLEIADAARQISFSFAVGRDVFVEIAKLRAARTLWSQILEDSGAVHDAPAMRIHARTSARTKSARDPWVNMLRGTAETFAAAVGGADSVATSPLDEALGVSDSFSRRLARNTQVMLQQESSLHRVVDPAGGSWYVEQLTRQLGAASWKTMQRIESEGGMAMVVCSGALAERLGSAAQRGEQLVARRKLAVTGINEFPNVREKALEREVPDPEALRKQAADTLLAHASSQSPELGHKLLELKHAPDGARMALCIEAVGAGASFSQLREAICRDDAVQVPRLRLSRFAESFERLRDASDAEAASNGRRPQAFLANLGAIPDHKARATFATNLIEAGGFETQGNDGFADEAAVTAAFRDSGAAVAVICASDAIYAEQAAGVARALREAGARAVVLAGKPGDAEPAYREAGVSHFIFMGCNVHETLSSLLERAGVL